LHQLPYHFYGGYTPEWYKHFGEKFGLEAKEIIPNGGLFKFLAQENARFKISINQHGHLHGEHKDSLAFLFGDWIPRYLFELDDQCFIDQFTTGYFIEMTKRNVVSSGGTDESRWGKSVNHWDANSLMDLAEKSFGEGKIGKARRLAQAALAVDPKSTRSKNLLEKI
jgi:hypothetical protein